MWLLKDTLPFSFTTVKDGLHKQRFTSGTGITLFRSIEIPSLCFGCTFFWCYLTWVLNGMVKVHIRDSHLLPDPRILLPFFFGIFVKESLFSLWKDCSHASEHFSLCCREKRNVKDAKWISATVCQAFAKDLWDIIPVDFHGHIGVWNCVTWVFLSISAMEIGISALCISGQVKRAQV